MIRPRLVYLHRILASVVVVGSFLPAFAQAADLKPIRVVTASDFVPYQGGMTAPNPPAEPPAAMTSRSSGERSAV